MKYLAATAAAATTFLLVVYLLTFIGIAARSPADWYLHSAPDIGSWNGAWGLIAAAAAFWLTMDWRTKVDAARRRKRIAARARA
jgi:hypothetical protein